MFQSRIWLGIASRASTRSIILSLILANLAFNVGSNASFKAAALSSSWRGFLTWQVVGNLAGFITVLSLTALLRYIPLHVAFTITTGLAVLGVQLFASTAVFHERVTPVHWLGTILVVAGIALVSQR